jgi:hypothetical protein
MNTTRYIGIRNLSRNVSPPPPGWLERRQELASAARRASQIIPSQMKLPELLSGNDEPESPLTGVAAARAAWKKRNAAAMAAKQRRSRKNRKTRKSRH